MTALGAIAVGAAVPALAQATSISEFKLPSGADPLAITEGPDGNVWFADGGTTKAIGRITPAGAITEFTSGLTHGTPNDITLGPDGNLWFTEVGAATNAIGRITPTGTITEFPLTPGAAGDGILVGPDHNIWFMDIANNQVGRVIPSSGTITEFGMGSGMLPGAHLNAMDVGPDGNLWFTDQGGTPPRIGRLTISAPDASPTKILEFSNATLKLPTDITGGSDGNVWFTDNNASVVGRITPSGTYTFYGMGNGLQTNGIPDAITLGPDNQIWFTDAFGSSPRMVGTVTPSAPLASQIKEYALTKPGAEVGITVGADGNVWVEQSNDGVPPDTGSIARITPSGVVTEFTNGLLPNANIDTDQIISGPDGNVWFSDRGAKAIGKVSLELPATATTGAASAITSNSATVAGTVEPFGAPTAVTFRYGTTPALGSTASAGTLAPSTDTSPVTASLTWLPGNTTIYYEVVADNGSGAATGTVKTFTTLPTPVPPVTTTTTTATFGDQQITLTTPSLQICTASTGKLSATLTSTAIKGSHAAKLRFSSAAFFIDKGVKHTHKRIRHLSHGRKKTITITVFTSNTTVHRVPATVSLSLKGLKSGTHTLKVVVSYKETITKRGHHRTVTVRKTVSARFKVC
jgi:streptogramin lyase